jgi:hypothetical protein
MFPSAVKITLSAVETSLFNVIWDESVAFTAVGQIRASDFFGRITEILNLGGCGRVVSRA